VTVGHCQEKYDDTGMYVGTIIVTEGMPHGVGTMNYDSGRVYSGTWVRGQWHGKGSCSIPTATHMKANLSLMRATDVVGVIIFGPQPIKASAFV
jgi:hypothetical protein